ncbi:bifunctional glutamate N-acetyltransferase/amino-acid acetyltransferase ArgJ [Nitrincola tapanii]|uniref:Arginine biosynthesis bifunctional protein ArgJ n=1 Tax=Nitrincola tapanii TaxID=1708751 RepID=A0A5A9VZK8_9GAMM|nr:bifunctional glutamate N-acetyltransferase/amino-acid acetyltransferase ArgJ [Nitrincola tapanii]KAA0873940.1 bifunctional glutamate N-acetyltransferase/amino-acid acetyltransferase ArgJ [Nitrincola tapanii]
MAVGANTPLNLHPVRGFRLGIGSAGIKKPGRKDLVIMEVPVGATLAGVFTRNQFCAAPVVLARRHLETGALPRYLLVNTGNANAGTGEQGLADALRCCQGLAEKMRVDAESIIPFSTGVIGEPLPVDKILAGLDSAIADLDENHWAQAAEGIMTTDTRPKGCSVQFEYQGQTLTLTGISKGAGMIMPNMATMLGYVATDAQVDALLLQRLLSEATERSFNRITVDGDTSTNDACVLVATGASGVEVSDLDPILMERFVAALDEVMLGLAHAIVKDGEGATKFVEVRVEAAANVEEALKVAYTIAHSPLVKTALFACDPNWGRILACVGRAGVENLDVSDVQIWLDDVRIVTDGARSADYREELGQAVMDRESLMIRVHLNRGQVVERVWTTDLSHDYVTINAEYRS